MRLTQFRDCNRLADRKVSGGLCRLSLALHAACNSSPTVRGAIPANRCILVTFAGV